MTLLDAGDRVALPDQAGMAYLGTVLGEDDLVDARVWVSWDDNPEYHQSVPEEHLMKLTPVPTTTGSTPVVVPGAITYQPRQRGWKRFGHWYALAAGVGAVAVGTWAMILLGGMH